MEIISKLGIDVKLILAQVVNFIILFFILKKLIYKPLLGLMDKRKKMISETVEGHQKIEERLKNLETQKEQAMQEVSAKAMQIIEQAKQDADAEKQKTMTAAKKEISTLAERYRAQLKLEKEELKGELAELVIVACERILRKEFNQEDQKRLETAINRELSSIELK